jgi:hypothetical protein
MRTNSLAAALALPDNELLARIDVLAVKERGTSAELVAHLAALELRPSLYAAEGYGSLFDYCTRALRLSEDAACSRIAAARACRDFPAILDLLASGSLTLTTVRMLKAHLKPENHEDVLVRAANRSREEIEALIAELAPKPDVTASVRKLPVPTVMVDHLSDPPASTLFDSGRTFAGPVSLPVGHPPETSAANPQTPGCPRRRPIVKPLAPERYRVQFTIGQKTHDKLCRVQALLRREVPTGDPGVIFERALDLLLEKVEKEKLGATPRRGQRTPQARSGRRAYENRIRPGTDNSPGRSRHIPNAVKRTVWRRDAGQCAFVSDAGRRCAERSFLELHHIQPYALDGPATAGNISLRCRRHNQYEAELVFGPGGPSSTGEAWEAYGCSSPRACGMET